MDGLRKRIKRFQKAIISRRKDEYEFGLLSMFPNNCCEFASLLLAKYLFETLITQSIEVVCGENRNNPTERHTWLKISGYNIDITAQQFNSSLPEVIISSKDGWHSTYRVIERMHFDPDFMQEYGSPEKEQIINDYEYLSSNA